MDANAGDLPGIAALIAHAGAHIWEVFFLVQVGRGTAAASLTAAGHEDVCHFLYDASAYGFIVRTVEAPFFRRVVRVPRRRPTARQRVVPRTGRPPHRSARPWHWAPKRPYRTHPRRPGHRVRRRRRAGLPGRFPAAGPRQHPRPAAARDLPARPAAQVNPRGQLRQAMRSLRVRRPVRRLTCPLTRRPVTHSAKTRPAPTSPAPGDDHGKWSTGRGSQTQTRLIGRFRRGRCPALASARNRRFRDGIPSCPAAAHLESGRIARSKPEARPFW